MTRDDLLLSVSNLRVTYESINAVNDISDRKSTRLNSSH